MTTPFEVAGRRLDVAQDYADDGALRLVIDGEIARARLEEEGEGVFTLELDGRRETIRIARDGDRFFLHLRGRTLEVRALDPLEEARGAARAERGEELVVAPMPGVVTELFVAVGDAVVPGQALLVIESMKLQTTLAGQVAGRVAEVAVALGENFEQGALLVRLEAGAEGGGGS